MLLVDGRLCFFLWPSGLNCSWLVRSFEAKDNSSISYLNSCSGTTNKLCAAASKVWEYLSFEAFVLFFIFNFWLVIFFIWIMYVLSAVVFALRNSWAVGDDRIYVCFLSSCCGVQIDGIGTAKVNPFAV